MVASGYIISNETTTIKSYYKARLVAQGFIQVQGLDYEKAFYPVVNFSLIRFFITLFVVALGWVQSHLNVKNVYLYGEFPDTTYMNQIPGFITKETTTHCLKLQKALYGLPQSGCQWHLEFEQSSKELIDTNCVYFMPWRINVLV